MSQTQQQKGGKAPTSAEYKSDDYYKHNEYTHYDIEREMVKYRAPQPSALPKVDYTWSQQPASKDQKRKN